MRDPRKIRIACISDSPKLTTGFGIVAKMIYQSFYDYGFDLSVFGILDVLPDEQDTLPYPFTPVSPMNIMGYSISNGQTQYAQFLRRHRPHLIFILTSPGEAKNYMGGIYDNRVAEWSYQGETYAPPVLLYTPIEGMPQHSSHGTLFAQVEALEGKVVFYCNSARKAMEEQFPGVNGEVVCHGHDHAPFKKYSDEDRKLLRQIAGLDDYFVVGAVGTNKRTKGWPTLIEAAKYLRYTGRDKGIIFYAHTDAKNSPMDSAIDLEDLAYVNGVRDMFIFKPDDIIRRGHPYLGVGYSENTLEDAKASGRIPRNKIQRDYLFGHYDLISRYNCMDMYVDVSQVEGWGLPPCEAMMCGIPTISVHDYGVRSEIHSQGALMLDAEPRKLWETWHTGSKLATVDPDIVAEAILIMKEDAEIRGKWAEKGQAAMSKYKWSEQGLKMCQIAHEIVNRKIGGRDE